MGELTNLMGFFSIIRVFLQGGSLRILLQFACCHPILKVEAPPLNRIGVIFVYFEIE